MKYLALTLLLTAPPLVATPVIDDAALNNQFSTILGEFADDNIPLQMNAAREALRKVAGAPVTIPQPADPITASSPATLYADCLPAVVAIGSVYDCGKCDKWHLGGFATGWIASPDGIVITNFHVIDKDQPHPTGVMTSDGTVYPVIEVLGGHEASDIAAIRVDTGGKALPYLTLADDVNVGEKIAVISNPKRRFFVYTSGVVSRFQYKPQRQQQQGERPVFMGITADYAVGSSGGPVFNQQGAVVGMVSSTFTATTQGPARANSEARNEIVQMVFKDCVSLQALHHALRYTAE